MEQFIDYVKSQGKIYAEDLKDYEPKHEKISRAAGKKAYEKGDYDRALYHCEKDLEINLAKYGEDHKETGVSYHWLGFIEKARGDYKKAEEFCLKSLAIYQKTLPDDHLDLGTSYNNLGSVYKNKGDYDKALDFLQQALKICALKLGEKHPTKKPPKKKKDCLVM